MSNRYLRLTKEEMSPEIVIFWPQVWLIFPKTEQALWCPRRGPLGRAKEPIKSGKLWRQHNLDAIV